MSASPSNSAIGVSSQKWELLFWLWFVSQLNQGDRQIYNAVLPLIGTDLPHGSTSSGRGTGLSALGFVYLLSAA